MIMEKEATYQRLPFDWEAHLKGEKYLGLSPVKITQMELDAKGFVVGLPGI